MMTKIIQSFKSWCTAIFFSAIALCFIGWLPINVSYGLSLWLGGNFTYANKLSEAISSFDAGDTAAAEAFMQKATTEAETYPFALGPDAGDDLAKRAEKLGSKALKDESSYARAAFLFGWAQAIRTHFSNRTTPWIIQKYLWFFNSSSKPTVRTRINSARAFNLENRCDKSEPVLLELSNELLNPLNRSFVNRFFDPSPKEVKKNKLSQKKLQHLILTETELVDTYQQKGPQELAVKHLQQVLELCTIKKVSPETIKECAQRLKEMGREDEALKVYAELHKHHFEEDDDV